MGLLHRRREIMEKACPRRFKEDRSTLETRCIMGACAWWVKNQFMPDGGCCVILTLSVPGLASAMRSKDGGS